MDCGFLEDWVNPDNLPRGVGIDLVSVSQLRLLDERIGGAFCKCTFSEREQQEAAASSDPWVYYAGRFAAKEAVFKAIAHLLPAESFDFRLVQTLHRTDGSPYIVLEGAIRTILENANVSSLLISITNEGDFAAAIVQAAVEKNI